MEEAREADGKRKMAFGPSVGRDEQMWHRDRTRKTDYYLEP